MTTLARVGTLVLILLLGGCAGITWPVALTIGGAAVGFTAKAIDLDKAILAPVCPARPPLKRDKPDDEDDDDAPPLHLIDI